jgi:response regulator of citrate/malate metabolism
MVTSRSELDMVSTSYYEGCNGYLNKPPTREKIKKAIDELGIV